MRGAERVPELFGSSRLESNPAPIARELRIWPRRNFEQLAPLGNRPEDAPSAVVDHQHNRICALGRRMRNFRSGHLKAAVTAQHQRPDLAPDLRAERGRHRKAHRRVKSLRQISAVVRDPDVEAAEQHVA